MQILQFILAWVVCLAGMPVGLAIGYISQKEVYIGRAYWVWLQRVIIMASVFFVLLIFNLVAAIIGALTILALQFVIKSTWPLYVLAAIMLTISAQSAQTFVVIALLTFFLGYPTANRLLLQLKKDKLPKSKEFTIHVKELLKANIIFPILMLVATIGMYFVL